MENEETTRTCGQCHKEVAEVNFALHETHCSRFLCLCPDCGEAVPRDQLNQHKEEQHTQVKCPKCNQKMERCRLADHEADECVERLQTCQFCELELPWKELDEHRLACGSRTELCKDCKRYVKLRDQPEHGLTCSVADSASSPQQIPSSATKRVTVTCGRCSGSFPAEDMDNHEIQCALATKAEQEEANGEDRGGSFRQRDTPQLSSTLKATSLSNALSRGPWGDGGDPDQISTCPHCHLALPLFTLRRHQVKCQIYIVLN